MICLHCKGVGYIYAPHLGDNWNRWQPCVPCGRSGILVLREDAGLASPIILLHYYHHHSLSDMECDSVGEAVGIGAAMGANGDGNPSHVTVGGQVVLDYDSLYSEMQKLGYD